MPLTVPHFLGAALVLCIISAVGVWSGRKVKSASDFSGGKKQAGRGIVAGALIGTIVGGASTIGTAQLVAGVVALVLSVGLYLLLCKTDVGRAMRATSEDKDIASVMGINSNRMFALAWGIAGACVGIAGALMSNYYYIYPDVGVTFSTIASAIVCLGGLGNIPGAVLAALLLGILQTTASYYVNSQYKLVIVYVFYIAIVVGRILITKRKKWVKKP